MGCPTRPSNVRVYQFHHFGTCENFNYRIHHEHRKNNCTTLLCFRQLQCILRSFVLFFHCGLFRIYRREPVRMPAVPAMDHVEESSLEFFR